MLNRLNKKNRLVKIRIKIDLLRRLSEIGFRTCQISKKSVFFIKVCREFNIRRESEKKGFRICSILSKSVFKNFFFYKINFNIIFFHKKVFVKPVYPLFHAP